MSISLAFHLRCSTWSVLNSLGRVLRLCAQSHLRTSIPERLSTFARSEAREASGYGDDEERAMPFPKGRQDNQAPNSDQPRGSDRHSYRNPLSRVTRKAGANLEGNNNFGQGSTFNAFLGFENKKGIHRDQKGNWWSEEKLGELPEALEASKAPTGKKSSFPLIPKFSWKTKKQKAKLKDEAAKLKDGPDNADDDDDRQSIDPNSDDSGEIVAVGERERRRY